MNPATAEAPAPAAPVERATERGPVGFMTAASDAIRDALLAHRLLVAGVVLYLLARAVAWGITGAPQLAFGSDLLVTYTGVAVISLWTTIFFIAYVVRACLVDRRTGGLLARETWAEFHRSYTTLPRLVDMGLVLALYFLASDTFVAFKGFITVHRPLLYDEAFARADRFLHGGRDPWNLLHPLLGTSDVTRILWINYTYSFFLGIGGLVVWVAWTRRVDLREQILLTLLGVWVLLGNAVAALFPAAGPAFYERVTGREGFAGLTEYLRQVDESVGLPVLEMQDVLWAQRLEGAAFAGGISAMPSIHVAMATLFVLVGWSVNRWLGLLATAFAAGIMMGSVHLGWHYAVDGYVSAPATVILWVGVGRVLRVERGQANAWVGVCRSASYSS